MTRGEFWEIVKTVGWNSDGDYEAGKAILLDKFKNFEEAQEFDAVLRSVKGELEQGQIEWCQENWEKRTCDLGDDSFSDLLYHIVGLGCEAFEHATANPWDVVKRARSYDFQESFSYCVPWKEDYDPTNVKLARAVDGLHYWEDRLELDSEAPTNIREVDRREEEVIKLREQLEAEGGGEELSRLEFLRTIHGDRAEEELKQEQARRVERRRGREVLATLTDEQREVLGL